MDELQLQHDLVASVIDLGGFALKTSHRDLVGVVDIWAKLPEFPGIWIEVKIHHGSLRRDGTIPLPITPHQSKFLSNVQKAGGHSGWVTAVDDRRGNLQFAAGIDPKADSAIMKPPQWRRTRGGPWPIREIIEFLTGG